MFDMFYHHVEIDKSMQHSGNWQGDVITQEHIDYGIKDVEYTRVLYYKREEGGKMVTYQ